MIRTQHYYTQHRFDTPLTLTNSIGKRLAISRENQHESLNSKYQTKVLSPTKSSLYQYTYVFVSI